MTDEFTKLKHLAVSQEISSEDRMFSSESVEHYFYVGRSNLWTILNVINVRMSYPGGDSEIKRIFDFGCGHGRVTRYLRGVFPNAELNVTDVDESGVQFCVDNFGCVDTKGEIPESNFDIVYLGSVFTHLPEYVVKPLLRKLLKSLNPCGVLIFTTQGRYSVERMRHFDWNNDENPQWLHYNLDASHFQRVVDMYNETGYGYVDYPNQSNYGVCIARPEWYANIALEGTDIVQVLFQEKGSDNHQDVSAFMRANLLDHSKGPLW